MYTLIWPLIMATSLVWGELLCAGQKRGAGKTPQLTTPAKRLRGQKLSPDELSRQLMCAVDAKNINRARVLLAAGANATRSVSEQGMPLHSAVSQGLVEIVKEMLNAGAVVDTVDRSGDTALHIAAKTKNCVVLSALLQACPDVNMRNRSGMAPLHIASRKGYVDIVRALLAGGANGNLLSGRGYTPLFYAARRGYDRVVSALLSENVDASMPCHQGKTALHSAVGAGHMSVLKLLLRAGVATHVIDSEATTPLHIAALRGDVLAVRLLIQANTPLDAVDVDGCSALHQALSAWPQQRDDRVTIVKALLEANANPSIAAVSYGTPLQQIAQGGESELMRLFIDYGAELISTKNGPKTALELFYNALSPQERRLQRAFIKELICQYASAMGDNGDSIVHRLLLAENPDDDLIRQFVRSKARVEDGTYRKRLINHKNQEGKSPLHVAAEKHPRYIKWFLHNGADRRAIMPNGETMDSILCNKRPAPMLTNDPEATRLMRVANKCVGRDLAVLEDLGDALKAEKDPAYVTRRYSNALSFCRLETAREMIRAAVLKRHRGEILEYLCEECAQPKVLAELQLQFAETYEEV